MSLKIYHYANCSTCKKALKFLESNSIEFSAIPIREKPPTKTELKDVLKAYDGEIRKLFNTSGMDYRELGMKEKLPSMSEKEAIDLLASRGNLVKRPFVVSKDAKLVGFKEDVWKQQFNIE